MVIGKYEVSQKRMTNSYYLLLMMEAMKTDVTFQCLSNPPFFSKYFFIMLDVKGSVHVLPNV